MDDRHGDREAAVRRIKSKRSFQTHLAVYILVNALLLVIWAVEGAGEDFWPFWTLIGWGIGVAFHWWSVYQRKPITEDEILREMETGT